MKRFLAILSIVGVVAGVARAQQTRPSTESCRVRRRAVHVSEALSASASTLCAAVQADDFNGNRCMQSASGYS